MTTTYQTKPQTVEAVQWRGDNEREIIAFFPAGTQFVWGADFWASVPKVGQLFIEAGLWVIRTELEDRSAYSTGTDAWFKENLEEKS